MKPIVVIFFILFSVFESFAHDHGRKSFEFVENQNQWHDNVKFKANVPGGSLFLEETCFTYKFYNQEDLSSRHELQFATIEEQNEYMLHGHSWKLHFVNAHSPVLNGEQKMNHYYNYFKGNEPYRWASNVGIYSAVYYNDLYEGINLRAYNKNKNFKYDFIVSPNSDPSQIILKLEGILNYSLQEGNLIIPTSIGEFKEMAPFAFQLIDGKIVEVSCNYVLKDGEISFEFPNGYNKDYKLTIDPELIAATLSGTASGADNYGHSATFDLDGNIYTACISFDSNYPTNTGAFQESYGGGGTDYGISKLNPNGTDLLWATFIGGNGSDYPHSMIANEDQELYIFGSTSSSDYPTSENAYQTAYGGGTDIGITALSSDGSALIGSTYLGGGSSDGSNAVSVNYGDTYRGEIVLDNDQKPVIASVTTSGDFPTTPGAFQSTNAGGQDAIVSRLSVDLSELEMSTFMGSSSDDVGYGVRVSSVGDVFLVGTAGASDFVTTDGAYQTDFLGGVLGFSGEGDGYVASFNSDGTELNACTFYATDDGDQVFFIDLDNQENVFIYGQGGEDMPVIGDVYSNPSSVQFIAKLTYDLSTLEVATTFGGSQFGGYSLVPVAFLVDICDNIYISGYNAAGNLETTSDALYDSGGFYIAGFTQNIQTLGFGTYYTSGHVDGGTSRFDKNGTIYQAVCSGGGFGTTEDAWATNQATGWDVGVFKIAFDLSGVNAASLSIDEYGCAPYELNFSNQSNGQEYEWDFGDGNESTDFEPFHTYDEPGDYTVTLIAKDSLSCNLADTLIFDISIGIPFDFTPSFEATEICENMSVLVDNTTDIDILNYVWNMGDGTILEGENIGEYIYDNPGTYTISLLAIDEGCNTDEEVTIDVDILPAVIADIGSNDLIECGELDFSFSNASPGADSYFWEFGDGSTSTEFDPSYIFVGPGTFEVTLTVHEGTDCETTDAIEVTMLEANPINFQYQVFAPQLCDSVADVLLDFTGNGADEVTWNMGDGNILEGEDHTYLYETLGTYDITVTAYHEICEVEMSETIEIEYDLALLNEELIIPNVFSPNRDGKNDNFRIFYNGESETDLFPEGKNFFDYLNDYSMQIFNRWGNEIFNSETDGNIWDGSLNGNDLPEGTYYYLISFRRKCLDSDVQTMSGTVEILR